MRRPYLACSVLLLLSCRIEPRVGVMGFCRHSDESAASAGRHERFVMQAVGWPAPAKVLDIRSVPFLQVEVDNSGGSFARRDLDVP